MFPEQQNQNTLLVQLTAEQLSVLISTTVFTEVQKLIPQIEKAIKSSFTDKKLYTRKETAERLGVSKTTLHNWMISGKLVPLKPGAGRKCLYTAEQLEAFLNQRDTDHPY